MNRIKFTTYMVTVSMLPTMASADVKAPSAAIAPMVVQPVQTFQPGPDGRLAYSYADVTKLIDSATQKYFEQRESDRAFLETSVKNIVDQYNEIYAKIYIEKLTRASQMSLSNALQAIPVDQFLELDREYKLAKEVYLNKVAGIQSIPKGGLPSAQIVVTENKSMDLPAWRSLNVDPIVNQFTGKIKELDAAVNALRFKVKDIMGIQQEVTGFNIDYTKLTLIRPEDRMIQQDNINKLKHIPILVSTRQDTFTGQIVKDAKVYVTQFGANERYRYRDDKDLASAKKVYDRVAQAFWARSWLRMKYGIGLGSFNMNYTKRWFNIEELMKSPSDFIDFGAVDERTGEYKSAVRSEDKLLNVMENIRLNAQVADHRATVGGSYSPLALATYLWTFVKGERALLETASMVLKMIEADVNEELLVTSGNGQTKMKEYYIGRYYLNPDAKKKAREFECAFDSETIEAVIQGNAETAEDRNFSCNNSGIGEMAQGGYTRTFFQNIDNDLKGLQENFTKAAELQAQLDAQTGNDRAMKKIVKGLKGL